MKSRTCISIIMEVSGSVSDSADVHGAPLPYSGNQRGGHRAPSVRINNHRLSNSERA
jgi:hypothetical protein